MSRIGPPPMAEAEPLVGLMVLAKELRKLLVPALVVEPQLDRDATPADVHLAVEQAKRVYALYGAAPKLALQEPWDYNRLPAKTQDEIIQWMAANLH